MNRDEAKAGVPKAHPSDVHSQYAMRTIELLGDLIGAVDNLASTLAGRPAPDGDGGNGPAGEPDTDAPVLVSEPAAPTAPARKRAPAKRARAS